MRSSRTARAFGFLLATITLTVGLTGVASATNAFKDPPVTSTNGASSAFISDVGQAFIDNQRTLGELKSWILAQPDVASSGYIEQVNDANHLATTLLWFGDDPLKESTLRHAKAMGIAATVEQRPQSLANINAAAKKIADSADELKAAGFTLSAVVGVQADTPTIQVEGEFASQANTKPYQLQSAQPDVTSAISAIAGVPVTVVGGKTAAPAATTRSTDTGPFYAGGYMVSGGTCSSGFALNYQDATHITTARHCRPSTGSYTARDGSASYGSVFATSTDGAVNLLSGTGSGFTFDGAWDNAAGVTKHVYNIYDVGLNDLICTSGGNSGVHCNVKVTASGVYFNDGYGSFSNIRGVQQTGTDIAAIQGDSGGPVFMPYGGGDAQRVGAVGVIQAVENGSTSNCGSVHDGGTNLCSKTVLFSSIHTVILYGLSGASLVTTS